MKHTLICLLVLALAGCAALSEGSRVAADSGAQGLLAQLPGQFDNHAQVWQAQQAGRQPSPVHVTHQVARLDDGLWVWTVRLDSGAAAKPLQARWRYRLESAASGGLVLVPERPLSDGENASWAPVVPCALRGGVENGILVLAADIAICKTMLPALGPDGTLLPLTVQFDGDLLQVASFVDQARGKDAMQQSARVRWFHGWLAINGAGPEAEADDRDWHARESLRIHDQGGRVRVTWRDGQPTGYSLQLERLRYASRDAQVLKLSLVRDRDGATVAYAWANHEASRIGINLGWFQAGFAIGAPAETH